MHEKHLYIAQHECLHIDSSSDDDDDDEDGGGSLYGFPLC